MPRSLALFLLLMAAASFATPAAVAQEWRPPSAAMPAMPTMSELQGDWLSPRADWFANLAAASGVAAEQLQPLGERHPTSQRAQIVHFNSGPLPVVVWSDRSGNGQADMVEIYRNGGLLIQLIDADYDGRANVLRLYDAQGTLVREDRV